MVTEAREENVPLRHDGFERPYLLCLPDGTAPLGGWPVMVALHGRGSDGPRFDRWVGFRTLAPRAGFALALPSALGAIWSDGRGLPPGYRAPGPDDVGYLTAVIDDALARAGGDPSRVGLVGMSNGAVMAGRMACERGDRIAAIAQVAGTAAVGVVAAAHPAARVAILSLHGTADHLDPYEGGSRSGLVAHLLLPRSSGSIVSVDAWARFWVGLNGDAPEPVVQRLGDDVTVRRWRGAGLASDLDFYRLEGGGHTWPGRTVLPRLLFGRTTVTIDATSLILTFLAVRRR